MWLIVTIMEKGLLNLQWENGDVNYLGPLGFKGENQQNPAEATRGNFLIHTYGKSEVVVVGGRLWLQTWLNPEIEVILSALSFPLYFFNCLPL